ncbi:hypothetical protein KY334_03325, partial [Candidatus Woesearchaeota archaeon]|nr:hypothetical protein [Candidatus Woesearchaeota archaeon]
MIRKIRHGVFETNSSSSHAISVCMFNKNELMDLSLIPDEDGNIVLNGGEFGWEKEKFYDAKTKASYLAVYANYFNNDEFKNVLSDVIKNQTGCENVVFNLSVDWNDANYSYIDHESTDGKQFHYLFKKENVLRQFIFNKNSVLITGNDNEDCYYDVTSDMLEIVIDNISNISIENYIDVLEETANFASFYSGKFESQKTYEIFNRLISKFRNFTYSDQEKANILSIAKSIKESYYNDELYFLIEDILDFDSTNLSNIKWYFESYPETANQL